MYKISISGKANSGKNTISKLIVKELRRHFEKEKRISCGYVAFADPIKAMIRIMFPNLPEKHLTGSSEHRSQIIPGAFKDGIPLTVRQLLLDLGTEIGRGYKEDIWLDALDHSCKKLQHKSAIIVTDVRFKNEFDHLRKIGFYQIRLLRDSSLKIKHTSEINQDTIADNEFDYVLHNNGTVDSLRNEAVKIVKILTS